LVSPKPKLYRFTKVPIISTTPDKYDAPGSDGKPRGLSGMGCLDRTADGNRQCLVIIDDETFGQVVTLKKEGLEITTSKVFYTEQEPSKIVGTKKPAPCAKTDDFEEFDGEGISITKDHSVYAVGSHSYSSKNKYKPSSYLLARFKAASASSFGTDPTIEYSWRVADVLAQSPVKDFYGKPKKVGTNIEGIAVIGDDVYLGLRTPVVGKESYILKASANALFKPGPDAYDGGVKPIPLPLGEDTGIRDLAALANRGLLVLSGPTDEQKVEYKIWYLPSPIDPATRSERVTVKTNLTGDDGKIAKAESLTVLEQNGDNVVVLINYDNINEGAPTRHEFTLK